MRTGSGRFATGARRDGSGDRRRAEIYSDEELWRVRYDRQVAEATFWRNFAFLQPFAVSTLIPGPEAHRPARITVPARVAPDGVPQIPHQRTRHPAVAELSERARRNSNRGGRT